MPTSAPGSSARAVHARVGHRHSAGFTLIELLIVIAIIALGVALVSVALPDADAARLDEEGERLSALLEMARAESRVSGAPVVWVPQNSNDAVKDNHGAPVHFRFVGLADKSAPTRWLDARISATIVGARSVVLGPSAILPAQRIVLALEGRRLELVSDGLGPFAVATAPVAAAVP